MAFDFTKQPGRVLLTRGAPKFDMPLVSIITPFYNAGKYFEQTFNSVLNQTFPWFDWIIVDDGSTNSEDIHILKEASARDSRITMITQENGGAVKARKLGISISRADIIIFLDADDLIEPQFVEYVYWSLIINSGASWAYTDQVGFHGSEYLWKKDFSSSFMKRENILSYCCAFRKEVFNRYADIYPDETRNMWEDWQLWLNLLAHGCYPVHIRLPLFWYRRLDTGELSKIDKNSALKERLQQRIKQLSQNVPEDVKAITFPQKEHKDFAPPKIFDFSFDDYIVKSDKTHILLLIPHIVKGGADFFNYEIARLLNHDKYELSIITTFLSHNDEEWMQSLQTNCSNTFSLKDFLTLKDYAGFIHYYIKSRSVDVVWNINSFYGYYLFPWLRINFKSLALANYVHNDSAYWRNGGYARLSAGFQDISDMTICTNQLTLNAIVDNYGMSPQKCKVSYIGVDTQQLNPESVKYGEIRTKFGIATDRPVVLFLCRLSPEKRPFLMLQIAASLKEKLDNVCFLVVGDGEMRERMDIEKRKLLLDDTVIFTGIQEDVRYAYKDANVLLICSLKEGLAQTTFEAMAMGLPVVSADVGGQSEMVNDSTGVLIPCMQDDETGLHDYNYSTDEINEYVNALYRILSVQNNDNEIYKENRNLVSEQFSTTKAVNDFELFTDELLSSAYTDKRVDVYNALSDVPNLCNEFVTIFNAYEKLEQTANEIWEAKIYFQRLADNVATKESQVMMFHWYARFLSDTLIGRFCWRMMKFVYNLFNRK